MNSRLVVLAVGLSLVVPAWIGTFAPGGRTLYSPLPALIIFPAFILSDWHLQLLPILIPCILFFLWSPGLLWNQRTNLPKRTLLLLGLLTVLTIVDWKVEWRYGLQYLGMQHTVLLCILGGIWLTGLWWMVLYCQRHPSLKVNVLTHWALFAWLAWYAFPYFGELP